MVKDMVGKRFGRLIVISRAENKSRKGRDAYWLCKCDCGAETTVCTGSLSAGRTRSCGCLAREKASEAKKHGDSDSRLYNIWRGMRARCRNKNLHRYGGRGISVCPEWESYLTFKEWAILNGYRDNLTIDRIDNDGNYTPDNCRWATYKQQNQNNSWTKLSDKDLEAVKRMADDGLSYIEISQEFDVSRAYINRIVLGTSGRVSCG